MGYAYTIGEPGGLVTVWCAGGRSIAVEAEETVQHLLADPRIGKADRMLILTDAMLPPPAADDIAPIAALVRLLRLRVVGRIAIVASGSALAIPAHAVSLLGSRPMLSGVEETRAFVTESAARSWLAGDSRSRPSSGEAPATT